MFKKNVFEVKSESRYTVVRTTKARCEKRTDANGKQYFYIRFYCRTKKGNIVEFFERRLDETEAKKKCYVLNYGTKEMKVEVACAEEVTSNNKTRKLLYGHVLKADYFKY